jgi:hypothetical protein
VGVGEKWGWVSGRETQNVLLTTRKNNRRPDFKFTYQSFHRYCVDYFNESGWIGYKMKKQAKLSNIQRYVDSNGWIQNEYQRKDSNK